MNNISSVLVVAAHPDDEMLGCGATLARLRQAGARVSILILGEGPAARDPAVRDPAFGAEACAEACACAMRAAAVLDIRDVRFSGLPDNRFDSIPLLEIIRQIEAVRDEIRPELVFTHFQGDLNVDHQRTQQAALTAFRPLPGAPAATLLSFEVLSSTEYAAPEGRACFQPNFFVDVADYLQLKQRALQAYASEMRPWPHPRSHEGVEHLARLRGSQCGRAAAEAFVLCRRVV